MSIPKKIHFVWPGRDEKTGLAAACIPTWRENLPDDWEIIEWNLDTFDFETHKKNNRFLREVIDRGLYAFIADYVRAHVLYEHGGIYLDTDVTILKEFTPEMLSHEMFLPIQSPTLVEPAIWGSVKGHPFLKDIIDFYDKGVWEKWEYILPQVLARHLKEQYGITHYKNRGEQEIFTTDDGKIAFYPEEYFIPYRYGEQFLPTCVKDVTTTVHWFKGSWMKNPKLDFLKKKAPMDKFKSRFNR